jgi:hypothetical protein
MLRGLPACQRPGFARRPSRPLSGRNGSRGIDVPLAVCRVLEITPDQLLRRAGLLPAEGEYPDEGFWELWGVHKRLTLRCAQGCAAEDRAEVVRFARFREWEGR